MPAAQLIAKNKKVFVDLGLEFDVHPNTKKLNLIYGDDAVVRSLKNLVMTNHYERPFHPEIGCNVRQMLFENIMPSTADSIQHAIEETIENFEPRVNLKQVRVTAKPDENGYIVTLEFFVINQTTARRIEFFLERVR